MPHAAVVVEDRYSALFKVERVAGAVLAEGLAEAQVAFPNVPIVFCETLLLAQAVGLPLLRGGVLALRRDRAASDVLADV